MVINVTDEQKKFIESQGYMVVEFKAWAKKLRESLLELADRFRNVWEQIVLFLRDKLLKTFDSLELLVERIREDFEPLVCELEDYDYEPRRKYPFVRFLGRKYNPNFSNRVIYHRCRDRC